MGTTTATAIVLDWARPCEGLSPPELKPGVLEADEVGFDVKLGFTVEVEVMTTVESPSGGALDAGVEGVLIGDVMLSGVDELG
jgi:hypothetical protein